MRGKRNAILQLVVVCLLACAARIPAGAAREMRVAVVPYSAPYQYLQGEEIVGANVDIFNKIAKKLGLSVSYVPYSTKSAAMSAAVDGEVDAVLGAQLNAESVPGLLYSTSLTQDDVCMMRDARKPLNESLSGKIYSAAVEQSIALSHEFFTPPNMTHWLSATTEGAYQQFLHQKLDYLIAPRATLLYYMKNETAAHRYIISDSYISAVQYGIALNGSPTLLYSINNEIMRLKTAGQLESILKQWVPEESVPNRVFYRYLVLFCLVGLLALAIIFIVMRINRYLKTQVDAKTQRLQILNRDLQEQMSHVRDTTELQTLLVQHNTQGVVVFNRENEITIFNETACKMAGEDLAPIGKDIYQIPLFGELLRSAGPHVDQHRHIDNRVARIVAPDGAVGLFRYNLFPLFTNGGEVRAMTLMLEDVTEQTRLESDLFEKEKNRSINRIVAGLAHEIRNPLTSVKAFVEVLPSRYDDGEFQQTFCDIVPGEIQRISQLITNLMEYAKPSKLTSSPIDVAQLVAGITELLRHGFEQKGVRLEAQSPQGVFVLANEQQLKQILINFLLNGLEAVQEKTENTARLVRLTATADEQRVFFLVEDDGIGMSEQQIKNATDPFYSTKRTGTGLGLYIAQRYAQRNNGVLSLESREGAYTKVHLCFPKYKTAGLES